MSDLEKLKLWQKLVKSYKDELTKDELDAILQIPDRAAVVEHMIADRNTTSIRTKKEAGKSRIERIDEGLKKYVDFFAVFASAVPEISTLIFGSLDLIYKRSQVSAEVQELISELIDKLCELAPRLHTYEKFSEEIKVLEDTLIVLYAAILDFLIEANKYTKNYPTSRSRLRQLAPSPPEPFALRDTLIKIEKAKASVEKEAVTAQTALHAKWHNELREELRTMFSTLQVKDRELPGKLPCRSIPYPSNARFVGRSQILKQLEDSLSGNQARQVSFALHGMGGVGKTQVALKFIYDHYDHFPVIFWMNADSIPKLSQSFVQAAKRLEIEPSDSQRDGESVTQELTRWLCETEEQWLIIFDNADNLEVLKSFWPRCKRGAIIITSRDPNSAKFAEKGVAVGPLESDESERLFLSLIAEPDDDEIDEEDKAMVKEVTKYLGYLPLAIDQVAHFLSEKGYSVDEFYDVYKSAITSSDTFAELNTTTANLFYERSLATCWSQSNGQLQLESESLLSILACLDPDGIPETIFLEGSRGIDDLKFLSEVRSYRNSVAELVRYGYIQQRKGSSRGNRKVSKSISVHRLIQDSIFHAQDQAHKDQAFSHAVSLCLNVFPQPTRSNFRLMHRWSECEQYLNHLLALEARQQNVPTLKLDQRLAELFLYGSWYLYERRSPELALPLLATARKICEQDDTVVDWFLRSRISQAFGCVLFECSRYAESEAHFRQALAIRLDEVDPEDILLAHGYQDTALAVTAQGRYSEAIALQEKALAVIELSGDDFTRRDMMFHVHHNMARTYEASGNPKKALELHFHQGDPFGNGLRKEMSESGAVNLYAIGNCYLALGDKRQGAEYHTRALKIRRELVGEQGFYYGISSHKMGCILCEDGASKEAKGAFTIARNIFEKSLDAQRELCRTLFHLSLVLKELGEVDEAESLFERAWKIRTEITGQPRKVGMEGACGFDELVIYIHA